MHANLHPSRRAVFSIALALTMVLLMLASACGSDGPDPVGPTPPPSPSPSPTPPPVPAPTPPPLPIPVPPVPLESVAVDPSVFVGGEMSTGTAKLSAPAPAAGTLVALASNSQAVSVPMSIRIAAGATSGTFPVATSVVAAAIDILIAGSTDGVLVRTASMRLLPRPAEARFSVTSPSGGDTCELAADGSIQCVLDGSASIGAINTWAWTYTIVRTAGHQTTVPVTSPVSTCSFAAGGTVLMDARGNRYVLMRIGLSVRDASGTFSPATTRSIALYTRGFCGY